MEKVLQIVECREVYANGCFLGTQVDIIHEEHPTVLDLDFPFAPAGSINL